MAFLDSAQKYVSTLQSGSKERFILEFLLNNAVGRYNAQPWPAIEKHLKLKGIEIRQQTFQQGLLKQSRTGEIFIGSNDHDPSRGYFIIKDKEDAEVMKQWYEKRIGIEQGHLDHLEKLMKNTWP